MSVLDRQGMSLGEAGERYWVEVAEGQTSAITTRYQLERLFAELGAETSLGEISGDLIARYVTNRRSQKSRRGGLIGPASVNREIELLRRVMRRAEMVWGVEVAKLDWKQLRLREAPPRQRVLSSEEEERLIAAAAEHLKSPIRFALLTGLRLNNIMNLDWRQIDMEAGVMYLVAKGGRSQALPVTPAIRMLLEDLAPKRRGPVFTYTPRGENSLPRAVKTWKTAWQGALKRAGIEDFRFHDLRHTVGTRLVQRGVDISIVRDVMGHADIETTRRYVHHDTARKAAALRLLDDA